MLLRAVDPAAVRSLVQRIDQDRRLHLQARPEIEYFRDQTRASAPIKILGSFIAFVMSVGACFAAMNAMYASVAYRTREIGTLQVLGFRRRQVLFAFLLESVLLAVAGGIVGGLLAIPIHGVSTGTMNFNTFSELAFHFRITPGMLAMRDRVCRVDGGVRRFPSRSACVPANDCDIPQGLTPCTLLQEFQQSTRLRRIARYSGMGNAMNPPAPPARA